MIVPGWPETLGALSGEPTVTTAILVRFDFRSGLERYWLGSGPLMAVDPMAGTTIREWSGIGELLAIDGIEQPIGDQAPQATFTLSGVDSTLLQKVRAASAEVKGRDVTVFLQFYKNQVRQGTPIAVYGGVMDVISTRMTGPGKASITVTAESPIVRRTSALAGGLLDQSMLWPLDRGLERVPQLPTKRPTWPYIEPPDK